jgi:hypothetical protein
MYLDKPWIIGVLCEVKSDSFNIHFDTSQWVNSIISGLQLRWYYYVFNAYLVNDVAFKPLIIC